MTTPETTTPKKRVKVEKNNVVLAELEVIYLPVDAVTPNDYNPNRQSEHDFELLCRSIREDGFTQPIIVQRTSREIVDGEHRWRACKALGYAEVPVVLTDMTPEQARIATLRHNRARGSENAVLASEVLKELQQIGALAHAQDSLMLDQSEVAKLLQDMPDDEVALMANVEVPPEMLGPSGRGMTAGDQSQNIDFAADQRRAKEKMLAEAKANEEAQFEAKDSRIYRVILFFTGQEAEIVARALGNSGGQAHAILAMCKESSASEP